MQTFHYGKLNVEIHADRVEMGKRAAAWAADEIGIVMRSRGTAAVLFSSADSQVDFLRALRREESIDWPRVTAYHVDEYAGVAANHAASFRGFLQKHLLDGVCIGAFHGICGEAPDTAAECVRYAALLNQAWPDLVVLGIGENGHLAFIDPGVCDFSDPRDVRLVELDEICRRQQVHDGAFSRIEDVPRTALSVTVPLLMRVPRVLVVVPGTRKAAAVKAALEGPVSPTCPASILQRHGRATLMLDVEAAAGLSMNSDRLN